VNRTFDENILKPEDYDCPDYFSSLSSSTNVEHVHSSLGFLRVISKKGSKKVFRNAVTDNIVFQKLKFSSQRWTPPLVSCYRAHEREKSESAECERKNAQSGFFLLTLNTGSPVPEMKAARQSELSFFCQSCAGGPVLLVFIWLSRSG
jgi:hypothetical protein